MSGVNTQKPKPAEHGSFIHQESVSGDQVNFVQTSGQAGGSLTVTAGAVGYINVTLNIYRDPATQKQVVGAQDCVAWHYMDVLIDSSNDYSFLYAIGSGLSAGQQKIVIGAVPVYSMVNANSQNFIYAVHNNDSSSHTIYVTSSWKYIITGNSATS